MLQCISIIFISCCAIKTPPSSSLALVSSLLLTSLSPLSLSLFALLLSLKYQAFPNLGLSVPGRHGHRCPRSCVHSSLANSVLPEAVALSVVRETPCDPLAPQTLLTLTAGEKDRGRVFDSQGARVQTCVLGTAADLWAPQVSGVMFLDQPGIVDVADVAVDFSHESPPPVLHVTVGLDRAIAVGFYPEASVLDTRFPILETSVVDLLTGVGWGVLLAKYSQVLTNRPERMCFAECDGWGAGNE